MGIGAVSRAVFLDRDGVLNHPVVREGKPYPPAALEDLRIVAEAPAALRELKRLGCLLIVVSNQPDVARGTQQRAVVEAINAALARAMPIDDFFICYHDDRDRCGCRKPLPGLVTQAANQYSIQLEKSFLVGDRWRDVEAGFRAGCRTVWIDCGYAEKAPANPPDARVTSIAGAARWIVGRIEDEDRR